MSKLSGGPCNRFVCHREIAITQMKFDRGGMIATFALELFAELRAIHCGPKLWEITAIVNEEDLQPGL
jgi:hypothetical protein